MPKAKVEFIPNHNVNDCWMCETKGYTISKTGYIRECRACGGIGKFIDRAYYLIYTDKNGVKNGFMVDSIK